MAHVCKSLGSHCLHWMVLRLLSSCGVLKPISLDLDPLACGDLGIGPTLMVVCWNPFLWGPWCPWKFGSWTHTYGGLMALGCYMVIGMLYHCDHAYEACWCICNFGMYSYMYFIYCNPMFIPGCFYYVFESYCLTPMFRSGGLLM